MLPKGYIEGVTRVSELVSHQYPFEGTDAKKRYQDWLKKNHIFENNYMHEAQTVGTFVHLQMEHAVRKRQPDIYKELYDIHIYEINAGYDFMKDYGLSDMETEVYCRDKHSRYQGSIDLVATNNEGKRILVDWKTWGIAKKKWGLPNKTTKPYSKLKKVALQLSLYAKALGNIDEVWVVWLHEEGYFAYKLDIVPDNELESLISRYQGFLAQKTMPQDWGELSPQIIINYEPMKIEIQTVIPGHTYSKASVTLENEDMQGGEDTEYYIEQAVSHQKKLLAKYTLPSKT